MIYYFFLRIYKKMVYYGLVINQICEVIFAWLFADPYRKQKKFVYMLFENACTFNNGLARIYLLNFQIILSKNLFGSETENDGDVSG